MLNTQIDNVLREQLIFPESQNLQQRGIADKIEDQCAQLLMENFVSAPPTSRRSIEDVNVENTYVDIKTSDAALKFKMPNMISIDRLRKLDRDLIYSFVIYDSNRKSILNTFSLYVYQLNWDHLAIQNLGKGQLQIRNMTEFLKSPVTSLTKEEWLSRLQKEAVAFYQKVQADAIKRENEWKLFSL